MSTSEGQCDGIAIVGAEGRFPGAGSIEKFWANLVGGVESVSFFSDTELAESGLDVDRLRRQGRYVAARGVLVGADCFDAAFFGIHPREAEVMDPQHRVFLEVCWTALERAGYAPDHAAGIVGVFGGVSFNTYYNHVLHERSDLRELVGGDLVMFGNEKDYLTTRVAYKFGLKGPAVSVSTACSSSLVAVCQACHALLAYQCDMALAGGASITVPQKRGYFYDEGNIGSFDGHTRAFDERAAGTVFSNGAGVVVLKRLEDAVRDGDQIYAVIKGAAINNDGSHRVSFGAPGVEGQSEVIAMAHALAGIDPESISYVEAHGTATPLGDPIEVAGLTRAFRMGTRARQFCALGSVKTNIGHLDAASGVAGLIKTMLALHYRTIPASLHFTGANPKLDLESSPFYVNAARQEWKTKPGVPRRAGVSSFGTGGTNAHVVLEEAPELLPSGPSRSSQVLVLSAKTSEALERATDNLVEHLGRIDRRNASEADGADASPALADTAFTLQTGRSPFVHRRIVVCSGPADGATALGPRDSTRVSTHRQLLVKPPVVFMFPGQGAQYAGMGAGLYGSEVVFRAEVDRCAEFLQPLLRVDLRAVMFAAGGAAEEAEQLLVQTRLAQPALFVIEYALAKLWMAWGIEPAAMIGHSVGEYVAGCLAGVFALEDALTLVARRGALVQAQTGGAMLAVRLPEQDILPMLNGRLAIAAVNAPSMCVVSGPYDAIDALEALLVSRDVSAQRLRTSHAFHSPMMDPVIAPFTDLVRQVKLDAPRIPYISNVTARWITELEATTPAYWAGHVRNAVRFADGVAELMKDSSRVLLEVGPGQTLSTFARQHPAKSADQIVLSSLPIRDRDLSGMLETLGKLWMTGVEVDWRGFYSAERRRRAVLPTYPFERTRHWPEGPCTATEASEPLLPAATGPRDPVQPVVPRRERLLGKVRSLLQQMSGMSLENVNPSVPFLELGLDSLLLTQVGSKIRAEYGIRISFRQLMEELSSPDALAAHLDSVLSAETVLPAAPAPAPALAPMPMTALAPSHSASLYRDVAAPGARAGSAATATIEALLAQQQDITNRVLGLLRRSEHQGEVAETSGEEAGITGRVSGTARQGTGSTDQASKPSGPFRVVDTSRSAALAADQQAFLDALIERYTARTRKSKEHTQAYRQRFADPRTVAGFKAFWKELVYPIVVDRSSGSRMWDIDGNEYIDFTMGFGTNLLGHSPAFVTAAIDAQLRKGIEVGPQTLLAGKVAELMCELTGMDRCAFCNTGSEAVLAAIRVARTVTGRPRIVYFTGDYHGIFDEVLQRVVGGPGEQQLMAVAPGIPVQSSEHVLILDYNRAESLDIIRAQGQEIAAVIVEPVQSRYPDLQPQAFLRQLREVTRATGSALVFDEIITGFRSHPGGVQALFGIRADMATYGKVIGGGMPMGALCGSAEYLDTLDGGFWEYGDRSIPEAGVTFFAGTYVRHPLAIAGAWATLNHLKAEGPALQQSLNERMAAVVQELNAFLVDSEAPLHIEHFSSFFWVRLNPKLKFASLLFLLLRDKGIHIFDGRLFFLSTAHSEADVRRLIGAFKESVREMQGAGFLPGRADLSHQPVSVVASGPSIASASPGPVVKAVAATITPAMTSTMTPLRTVRSVASPASPMEFSVYFFGTYAAPYASDKYRLIFETATFADQHGFSAIWFPERHFHPVGGFSPNPAVIASALARETSNIHLRAGSVVLPLHNPIRVAEEWSVVDNLSRGRVGLSIASGWHPDDFVFAPEAYDKRRELCTEGVEIIRRLWAGESIPARGGTGNELQVSLYPMPMQRELPLWLTCVQAGSYEKAGELGLGVLAMLTNQTLEEVAEKITLYRRALAAHGHDPAKGHVTLLVHTFVGREVDEAVGKARGPMREYLRSYLDNSQKRHESVSGAPRMDEEDLEYLLDRSFDDYMAGKALIGSPESCAPTVARLREIGVDELGCFLDFGVDAESVLASLPHLNELKRRCESAAASGDTGTVDAAPLIRAISDGENQAAVTLPMTEAQEGLTLLARLTPAGGRAYAEVTTLIMRGPLEVHLLGRALQALVERHEALRTTIDADNERQTIQAHATITVPFVDLSRVPDEERATRLADQFADVESHMVDLSHAPVLRARLLRLAADHHLLILTFHHIFGNGPSYEVFFQELCDIYSALCERTTPHLEPAMQLSDYVSWKEQQLGTPEFEQDWAFWRQQFADSLPVLDLPTDRQRPSFMTYCGGRQSLTLSGRLAGDLRKVSGKLRASLFMTLFAAFNVLLHRLSGQDDIVVGVPFEGAVRSAPGGAHLFANTTNMIPLRSRIHSTASFADVLSQTKSLVFEANEHQTYFVGRLLQDLKIRPDLSRPAMFATSFNLERGTFRRRCGALDVELAVENVPFGSPRGTSKFDLAVNVADTGRDLRLDCDYNSDVFEAATIERWLRHFQTMLEAITANPAETIGRLAILTDAERRELIVDWNKTDVAFPAPQTVHELIERQVQQTPDAVAVTFAGRHLTYAELDRRANQLANLLRTQGIGPERLVGICVERSLEMVVGLLAILKSGGAYVPLDPSYPADRLAFMLTDAAVDVLLTQEHLLAVLPRHDAATICLDADWRAIAKESEDPPDTSVGPDNLAYMIYTSGSTGKPKGALNMHRGIANKLSWMQNEYRLTATDVVLQKTPFSFDISVWEVFWPLLAGARLVVARPGGHQDPDYLVQTIIREQITVMHFVPSMLRIFLEAPNVSSCVSLRDVICSGEALPREVVDAFYAKLPASLHNLYGPTEAAVEVTFWQCPRVSRRATVPIGRPVANTRCYILDAELNPVPIGIPGELHLGGVQVGRGYHGRPELTGEKFIGNPFCPESDARLYKTGDVCRYLPDGTIEYLGRMDDQVKIRGFRIELGEIVAVLGRHAAVKQCVVIACEDKAGDQRLVAYIESASGSIPTVDDLHAHLGKVLPAYMLPAAFVVMDRLPLTTSGKLDRRALPPPSEERPILQSTFVVPRTPMEEALAQIFCDLLSVATVGIHDDFFSLGGHSLLAIRLISRVREAVGVELMVGEVFGGPNISDLAKLIEDRRGAPTPSTSITPRSRRRALLTTSGG